MRAVVMREPGEPEVLEIQERETPKVKEGTVKIAVRAAGVNRPDVIQRQGKYPAPEGVPADIPGLEVAGIISEIGDGVDEWKVGDKVCALLAGGGYASEVIVPTQQCLPIPEGLSYEEASALPETFFTVWTNVFDRGQFKSGETFLIHGGTSGIGVAAIQMVKAMGGEVYATAGSAEKCAFAEKIGATHAVNYKESDFLEVLKEKQPEGIDVILDMVGGDYTAKNIDLLKPEGRLLIINAMKSATSEINMKKVMVKRLTITGSTLRTRSADFKGAIATQLKDKIWPKLSTKEIKPIVYKTFPLEKAKEAHQLMESSSHIGKIVLTID